MKFREPKKSDFKVPVEGVGQFIFGRRTMNDEVKIAQEYSRIIGDVENPSWYLNMLGNCLSILRILTVEAPEGWDLDTLDPLDDDTYASLVKVATSLKEQEERFRKPARDDGEEAGAAMGELSGPLVSPNVQATA
ncbi:hypothetical protein KD576_004183 [Salmonella enterica subsp. enterica serovar Thompson]|nr:hypothetical protein [Salmonella enterica]EHP7123041.1 hypothetical protein [Salmonella enterica subsp. enterica serovar Thompson]EHP7219047.1 hypothetical protein [Salmonella enterica subsp. enterica serovar Thompson]HAF3525061.1 hypothetical protein [Salmonella enterica]HAF6964895.1 hypothetical protein [Salmonella enterica]